MEMHQSSEAASLSSLKAEIIAAKGTTGSSGSRCLLPGTAVPTTLAHSALSGETLLPKVSPLPEK